MVPNRDISVPSIARESTLEAESVNLVEVFFQSLTYISPGTSLALVLPFVVVLPVVLYHSW